MPTHSMVPARFYGEGTQPFLLKSFRIAAFRSRHDIFLGSWILASINKKNIGGLATDESSIPSYFPHVLFGIRKQKTQWGVHSIPNKLTGKVSSRVAGIFSISPAVGLRVTHTPSFLEVC